MKVPSRVASGRDFIICPACGRGELQARGHDSAECDSCGRDVEGAVLRTLEQIVALPDALGEHACECGHPEMRHLPGGVFHCPACGSEVVPFRAGAAHATLSWLSRLERYSPCWSAPCSPRPTRKEATWWEL